MRSLYLFLFLLFSSFVFGQVLPYKFSSSIDSIMKYDTIPWRYQPAAWDFSYIGEYQAALKIMDFPYASKRAVRTKEKLHGYLKEPKAILSFYKPIPAQEYIIQEAKKARIVIINEAHHNPSHRVFAESLLLNLSKQGYDFLGLETLNYGDSGINKRKYPVLSSGYYSKEPAFGNMIRTALSLNYTVFPYETKRDVNGKDREIDQAENIKMVLDKNPGSKFIIYCGFDHVIEDSTRNGWVLAMAGRLKEMTGIDPLTIDQVALTETGDLTYDNFYRQAIDLNYPAVLIDSSGKAFNKAAPGKTIDIQVYHPTTQYVNGRPDWLLTKNKKYVNIAAEITIAFPCLVMAYNKGEDTDIAVPTDIIELKGKEENKMLVVNKKGTKVIVAVNNKNERQAFEIK